MTPEDPFDPDYLEGLESAPFEEVRRRLLVCREREEVLSYCRRLLHGKLDILKAELDSRADGADAGAEEVAERLTSILGGRTGGSRGARPRLPSEAAQEAALARIEALASKELLARPSDLDNERIEALVGRIMGAEREVSDQRRVVHGLIDVLEKELVRRYRSGEASPEDLLGGDGGRAD